MAARLGLPTAPREVIEVGPDLIELTGELVIQLGVARTSCRAGRQFGSGYPGDPRQVTVHDFLPDEQLLQVEIWMILSACWCSTSGRATPTAARPFFSRNPGGLATRLG